MSVRQGDVMDRAGGWPWRWALAAALATALFVLLGSAVERVQVDLGTYLLGARHVLGGDLYRVVYAPTGLGYTYPPFLALLCRPLTALPYGVDQVVVTLGNVEALLGLVVVCLRAARPDLDRRAAWWWSLLLLVPAALLDPVRETFTLGQVNVLVVLASVADLVRPDGLALFGTRRRIPQGILVGVAAAVKLTPLAFVPVLWWAGRRRAALRSGATFGVVAAVAALVAPRASWVYWTRAVFDVRRIGSMAWVGNQSLRGAVLRLAHHDVPVLTTDLLGLAVLAVGVAVAAACYRRSSPLLAAVAGWAAESLASPVTWTAQLVWIVPLLAWLVLAEDRPARGRRWAVAVAAVAWLAPNWWLPGSRQAGPAQYAERWWQLPVGDAFVLLAAAVVVVAGVQAWRRHAEAPGELGELVGLRAVRADWAAPRRARAGLGR